MKYDDEVSPLSNRALDILMPVTTVEAIGIGYLSGFIRRLDKAIDNATDGELRDWAWNAMQSFPSVPTEAEVAQQFPPFYLPMPEWA